MRVDLIEAVITSGNTGASLNCLAVTIFSVWMVGEDLSVRNTGKSCMVVTPAIDSSSIALISLKYFEIIPRMLQHLISYSVPCLCSLLRHLSILDNAYLLLVIISPPSLISAQYSISCVSITEKSSIFYI